MAIIRTYVDDIDGTQETVGTFAFAIGGNYYEIDLSKVNTDKFNEAVKEYVDHARGITRTRYQALAPEIKPNGMASDNSAIREWARANGHTVNERGAIPREIMDAFEKAQASESDDTSKSGDE